jgi:4-amino-4-deoxy-L-arabinose transferase-like glycosyltransferase
MVPIQSPRAQHRWILAIALLSVALRLPAIFQIPIFYDESIYLQRALVFPAALPSTLVDGKFIQELLIAALVLLPGDPLTTGRVLSLVAGIATICMLYAVGQLLGQPVAGLLAAWFYAISPLAILHDGLALPDALLTTMSCCVVLSSIRLASLPQPTRWHAAIAGLAIGVAALVKLPGLFLFCAPVFTMLLLCDPSERRQRAALLRVVLIAALMLPAALAPFHYGAAESHKLGGDWLTVRITNGLLISDWVWRYLPGGLLVLSFLFLLVQRPNRTLEWRAVAWLLASGICFIGAFVVLGSRQAPRYLLPAWPFLILSISIAATMLWKQAAPLQQPLRWLSGLLIAAACGWCGYYAIVFIQEPIRAPLAELDRQQYFEAWTAGYQVDGVLATLRQQADMHGAITVVMDSQARTIGNGAQIYLRNDPRIRLVSVELPFPEADSAIAAFARTQPTYLLADQQQVDGYALTTRFATAQEVVALKNPYSQMYFYVYRILP